MTQGSLLSAFDVLDDPVFAVDGRATLVAWNDAAGGVTGYDDDVLAETTLPELVVVGDRKRVREALDAAREPGREAVEVTVTLLTADDERLPYELSVGRLADRTVDTDGSDLVVCVGREATTEPRLHDVGEREAVLRETYEIMADRELSFTDRVEALLDVGRRVLGTSYGTLSSIDGEEYVFEVVRADDDAVRAGESVSLSATNCERAVAAERTLVLADVARDAPELTDRVGFTDWGIVCYLGAPVSVDGEVYGTFCFYDDTPRAEPFSEWEVTLVDLMSRWVSVDLARRRTTDRLRRQNAQLEQFAAVVSHDLRNPINVIEGSLELAAETGDAEHFARAQRAIDRMDRLVDDLLSLARAGETIDDPEPVSLSAVADRAWRTTETDGATLVVDADRTVVADESRLRQLFANLFRNSVEHGSTSSRPSADATDGSEDGDESDGVTVRVEPLADGFAVVDDGPGIPAGEREQVFESGYSTAEDGTGFGLSIVAQVAEAHGWNVSLRDGDGGGARFEFTGVDVENDDSGTERDGS
ncbi:ATP-binding protein [Salinigranum marinum]|uniref:ATP-binding protein n=1 Tax=Salinigranum marinum TaxID=1515595 RepID=UPI002989BF05|nr:ATP-binding protein [Salinigranum marinum]